MSSFAKKRDNAASLARNIWFSDDFICLELADGREIKTPLEFYPKLLAATPEEREHFEIIGLGTGIHWEKRKRQKTNLTNT